jgi:hypothetical protein
VDGVADSPDPIINAIDRAFEAADKTLGALDRVLNRSEHLNQKLRARGKSIDTSPSVKVKKSSSPPSRSTTLATKPKPQFRIVEAIATETGKPIFVVTNGTVSAECTTRELAEKILRGLEA